MANIQYTIRGIPATVDKRLRRLARLRGQSLNQVVIEQLSTQDTAIDGRKPQVKGGTLNADFDDLFGKMTPLDPEVENALLAQRTVNAKDW